MQDPWRELIDSVHVEIDAHRAKLGLPPYTWAKHEPQRATHMDRIVEVVNKEEETSMAFGDRQPDLATPLGQKPDGCDSIPGFGYLRHGKCRTEDCDNHRHAMGKASGYCRPCKIKHGLLKPDKLKEVAPIPSPKPWVSPVERAEVLAKKVVESQVPPELVDEIFRFLIPQQHLRLLRAMIDMWDELPLTAKIKIVRAALTTKETAQ